MTKLEKGSDNETVITLTIKDKVVLHKYYMPFVSGGGLFIPNRMDYELGDDVSIALSLMDEAEKIRITGKVVWVASKGVKSPHVPGIGVQFNDPGNIAKDKIETCLTGSLGASDSTATM